MQCKISECVERLQAESLLSPQQSRIYALKHVAGNSIQEIADRLGVSTGSVRRQLQRVRDKTGKSRRHLKILEEYTQDD